MPLFFIHVDDHILQALLLLECNLQEIICNDKVAVRVTSPSAVSQFDSCQQEVLVIFRGEHLLLPPLFLGHDLLHLGLLTETREHQISSA